MGEKVSLSFAEDAEGPYIRIDVHDATLAGHAATLRVARVAHVTRSSPVHHERVVLEHPLKLSAGAQSVALPADATRGWIYRGKQLELRTVARLTVDDGLLFDTTEEAHAAAPVFAGPLAPHESHRQAEPSDRFSLLANLKAIPGRNRIIAIGLLVVGIPIMLANALLGWHDQMSPPGQTIFYDHENSDGESQSPLVAALTGSGGIGLALWLALRAQLRRYMTLEAVPDAPRDLPPDARIEPRQLVRGSARVPLERCTARVVASNRERGQYTHKSKNRTETRSFSTVVRSVVLWEQHLPHVPANTPLQDWFSGTLDLSRLHTGLHPPEMVGDKHGVDIVWEFQLIHPDFVDQEIALAEPRLGVG
jgi:hypothetical protein